jgi:hypothetical protein
MVGGYCHPYRALLFDGTYCTLPAVAKFSDCPDICCAKAGSVLPDGVAFTEGKLVRRQLATNTRKAEAAIRNRARRLRETLPQATKGVWPKATCIAVN